jgi:hypothetical protein
MEPIGCPEMSVLLPMILVQKQIRNMLSRDRQNYIRKNKVKI